LHRWQIRCVRISRAIIIKDARRILHSEKK
jgi:hypothetical protein